MSEIIADYRRPYEVRYARTTYTLNGITTQGPWEFHSSHDTETEARQAADNIAGQHPYVQIIKVD